MQAIVKNFQSIDEVKLNIKGFTLLVGESNQGKSATLRALRAAVTNRFRSGQVRNGTPKAEIGIKFSDTEPILRVAKPEGGSATMKLGDMEFSKLGRTVPKDVTDVCNMECIGDDGYNLNFHEQFEAPMLLEFSQAKVMELLSASDALDDLNLCKEGLLERRAENKGAFSSLDAILSRLKIEKIAVSQIVDGFRGAYDALCETEADYDRVCKTIEGIESLSEGLRELRGYADRIVALRAVIECIEGMPEGGTKYGQLIGLRAEFRVLDAKRTKMDNLCKRVDKGIACVADVAAKTAAIDTLLDMRSRMCEYGNRISELDKFVNGGICPICGNKVDDCLC